MSYVLNRKWGALHATGLDTQLKEPNLTAHQLGGLIEAVFNQYDSGFPSSYRMEPSRQNTNQTATYKVTCQLPNQSKEMTVYMYMQHTPNGWMIDESAFILQLRKALWPASDDAHAAFANAMEKLGISRIYRPVNSMQQTAQNIRNQDGWQAAERAVYVWQD